MRLIAISGAASGIGAAIRRRLERDGARVLGIDLRDAEIIADLSHAEGRAAAIAAVRERSRGTLDGLVACAGLGPQVVDHERVVSVNYFGARDLLAGLRDALAAGQQPSAVAISSNSSRMPGMETSLAAACLAGQEDEARALARSLDGSQVYAGSKLALARWVRRQAPTPEWAGCGVRLNAVAPGATMTPLLQDGLDDPHYGPAIRGFPVPLGGFGTPDQIAGAVAFLLGPDGTFCCGSILYVDGGSDAMIRQDDY